jgi:hypothetical protein
MSIDPKSAAALVGKTCRSKLGHTKRPNKCIQIYVKHRASKMNYDHFPHLNSLDPVLKNGQIEVHKTKLLGVRRWIEHKRTCNTLAVLKGALSYWHVLACPPE